MLSYAKVARLALVMFQLTKYSTGRGLQQSLPVINQDPPQVSCLAAGVISQQSGSVMRSANLPELSTSPLDIFSLLSQDDIPRIQEALQDDSIHSIEDIKQKYPWLYCTDIQGTPVINDYELQVSQDELEQQQQALLPPVTQIEVTVPDLIGTRDQQQPTLLLEEDPQDPRSPPLPPGVGPQTGPCCGCQCSTNPTITRCPSWCCGSNYYTKKCIVGNEKKEKTFLKKWEHVKDCGQCKQ